MLNIQVSWVKGNNEDVADLSPLRLAQCSNAFANGLSMDRFDVSSDDKCWILTFKGPDLQTMLISSRSIIEVIRYQAHPMSGFGGVGALREFVGDDQATVAELNIVLTALDKAQNELEASEIRRRDLKEEVKKAAQNLKKTRSDFFSSKIQAVRKNLEALAR